MKRSMFFAVTATFLFTLTLGSPAFAGEGHGHGDKSQGVHGDQGHGSEGHVMDHSAHSGELVHESTVDGYAMAYHLIDVREKMAEMKDMPGMKPMTHHMMVYIKDPQGNKVEDAKVGYLVEGPDGEAQKVMCMGMSGGFGGDVNFDKKGAYTVKAKAVAGDKKLMDSFTYDAK